MLRPVQDFPADQNHSESGRGQLAACSSQASFSAVHLPDQHLGLGTRCDPQLGGARTAGANRQLPAARSFRRPGPLAPDRRAAAPRRAQLRDVPAGSTLPHRVEAGATHSHHRVRVPAGGDRHPVAGKITKRQLPLLIARRAPASSGLIHIWMKCTGSARASDRSDRHHCARLCTMPEPALIRCASPG